MTSRFNHIRNKNQSRFSKMKGGKSLYVELSDERNRLKVENTSLKYENRYLTNQVTVSINHVEKVNTELKDLYEKLDSINKYGIATTPKNLDAEYDYTRPLRYSIQMKSITDFNINPLNNDSCNDVDIVFGEMYATVSTVVFDNVYRKFQHRLQTKDGLHVYWIDDQTIRFLEKDYCNFIANSIYSELKRHKGNMYGRY